MNRTAFFCGPTPCPSETTRPLAWLAQRLRMGSGGYLAWRLQQPTRDRSTPGGQGLLAI